MEWIEVSARTLDEARELALDRLGVVAEELEYEVLDEPRGGLFGLGRSDARIRARVKPLSREKPPDRRRRRSAERRPGGGRRPRGEGGRGEGRGDGGRGGSASRDGGDAASTEKPPRPDGQGATRSRPRSRSRSRRGSGAGAEGARSDDGPRTQLHHDRPEEPDVDTEEMDVEAQAERAGEFVRELVETIGLHGAVRARVDDETVLVDVEGEGLGLLVGPKGATLLAIEELTRAVVQRGLTGRSARLRVDVAGYREQRRAALAVFARKVAQEVLDSGAERSLEPMSPPDRKVVHDAVAEIDGVATTSEGEEPRRRVVIRPA